MRSRRFAAENKRVAAQRRPRSLSVEPLEELVLLSASGWQADYDHWQQQTFSVGSLDLAGVEVDQMVFSADTLSASAQAGKSLQLIGGDQVQQGFGYTGAGYTVAILDTGVDYTHSALASSYAGGWDFVDNDPDPMDRHGHGTHVAGIIASSDATYRGVAPDVRFLALRVLNDSGSGSFGDVEEALQWVARYQAQYNIVAVNMSLGSGNFSVNPWAFMEDELATLEAQGVFVSAASGNSFYTYGSQPGLGYPAISAGTVSVGAVWDDSYGAVSWGSGGRDYSTGTDRIASFTQRSAGLDILAPGGFIKSSYLGGRWATLAGTSMAAPVVAGGAVLVHQAMDAAGLGHLANQDYILNVMQKTGVTVVDGDDENDNVTNTWMKFKRLNLAAAVASLGSQDNQKPQSPTVTLSAVEVYVSAVYQELLGRSPDAAGLAYWTQQINSGAGRTSVAHAIWSSAEFQAGQVGSYYANFFHRAPRADELAYWTNVLASAASDSAVPRAFLTSGEYAALHPTDSAFVAAAYRDVLGRPADAGGLAFWTNQLAAGGDRATVAEALLTSAEFRLNTIESYYHDFLGRTPGSNESRWWLTQVASGGVALRSIGELFLGSDEYFVLASVAGSSAGSSMAAALSSAGRLSALADGPSHALALQFAGSEFAVAQPAPFASVSHHVSHATRSVAAEAPEAVQQALDAVADEPLRLTAISGPRSTNTMNDLVEHWLETLPTNDLDAAIAQFLDDPGES